MVTPVIMAAFLATTSYSVFAANGATAPTNAEVNASKVAATNAQKERFAHVTPAMAGLPTPAVPAATTAQEQNTQGAVGQGTPAEAMAPKAPQAQASAAQQTKQPTRQSPQVQQERDRLAKEAGAEPATATQKAKKVEDKTTKKADVETDAKAQAKAAKADKDAKKDATKNAVKNDKKASNNAAAANQNAVVARNGENFAFKADNQKLQGNVLADDKTTIALALTNGSEFAGAINGDNKAKAAELYLSKDSVWEVTGDSNITKLTNEDPTNTNIHTNGYKVNVKK